MCQLISIAYIGAQNNESSSFSTDRSLASESVSPHVSANIHGCIKQQELGISTTQEKATFVHPVFFILLKLNDNFQCTVFMRLLGQIVT